jgi:ribosomal protein S18 acetylase RimI-like enzyme
MDASVVVREAREGDARPVAEVHVASWRAAYRGLLPDELLASLSVEERTERWQEWLRGGVGMIVLERDEAVMGFAAFGPARDGDADVGEVYAIYLDPREWGRGSGRALMDAAVARLRESGFDEAVLWVLETNERARRFYGAGGWRTDGATKVDIRRGFELPEVRYRREL